MKKVIVAFAALASLSGCNQFIDEQQKKTEKAAAKTGLIEITTFQLNKGVSSSDFLKSAEQMQKDFLLNQNGFVKRTLTNTGDTLWTDIVYWENEDTQSKAMKAAEKAVQVIPFMEKIDFASVKMLLTKPVFSTE